MSPHGITMVSICPWSYLGAYKSEQACVKTIWLKIVWVTCHSSVQFICSASSSTVLQLEISVLFVRHKEFVDNIANYKASAEIHTYWMPEMREGSLVREWMKT